MKSEMEEWERWERFYRLRHVDLRVIYIFEVPNDTVVIVPIGPRRDVYK